MAEIVSQTAGSAKSSSRLAFVDGLRGLSAFLIVLTHVYWEICPEGDAGGLPRRLALLLHPIAVSNKVPAFIVVSGFGLGLAALKAGAGVPELKGGFVAFLKRRARRILPPYYAALAISLALIAFLPAMHSRTGMRWDSAIPPSGFRGAILSHLMLLHNLHPNWHTRIDPPMWSLAVEWQMYFVFALLLLPLWRKCGLAAAVSAACLLGFLPHFLLRPDWNYDQTCPWYVSLFSLGMIAAAVRPTPGLRREAGVASFFLGAVALSFCFIGKDWFGSERRLISDVITGLFAAFLIVYCRASAVLKQPGGVLNFLQGHLIVSLGSISYSLYLVHFPILSLMHFTLLKWLPQTPRGLAVQLAILYAAGVPFSLGAAWLFSRVFERTRPVSPKPAAGVAAGGL